MAFWVPSSDRESLLAAGVLPLERLPGAFLLNRSPSLRFQQNSGLVALNANALVRLNGAQPASSQGDSFFLNHVVATPTDSLETEQLYTDVGAGQGSSRAVVPTATASDTTAQSDADYQASLAYTATAEEQAQAAQQAAADALTALNINLANVAQVQLNASPIIYPVGTAPSVEQTSPDVPTYVAPTDTSTATDNPGAPYGMTAEEYAAWVNAPAVPAQDTNSIITGEAMYVDQFYGGAIDATSEPIV